jgi:integrase
VRHRRPGRGRTWCRRGIWQLDYWADGKRHRESAGTRRRSEARQLLASRIALSRPAGIAADLRLSAALDALLADYIVRRRRSVRRVRICAAHLIAHFGAKRPVRAIGTADVDEYQAARLRAGKGPGTARLEAAVLRRALNLAALLGRVPHVPKVRLLPAPPPRSGFVERPELDRILAHLPEHVRPAVLAAYLTGWRIRSELLSRQWRHVTFNAPATLRLDSGEGKTGAGREYPLLAELLGVMWAQRAKAEQIEQRTGRAVPWVFFHDDGRPLLSIATDWRKAVALAGLAGVRLHDLRRSHVRNLMRGGVPSHVAMELVGHKTRSMLDRYSITDSRALAESVAKFYANQPQDGHTPTAPSRTSVSETEITL